MPNSEKKSAAQAINETVCCLSDHHPLAEAVRRKKNKAARMRRATIVWVPSGSDIRAFSG
jgi:hypothetical protein